MNLNKARKIAAEIDAEYKIGIKPHMWKDFYDDESEIVDDLKLVYVPEQKVNHVFNLYTGWVYIHSFAKQVQSGKDLTEKQMTMAKRLAGQIFKAAAVSEYLK